MTDYLGLGALHGFSTSWRNMHARCYNVRHNRYKNYGARGILVAPEWHDFQNFYADMFSTWRRSLQLDRINLQDSYHKENCRWVSLQENTRVRTSSKLTQAQAEEIKARFRPGATYQIELAKEFGVSSRMIRYIGAEKAWKK